MSEQTNDLLHLFSKLLRSPRIMMALRMEMMRCKLRNPGGRKGAQGLLIELWKQEGLTNAEIAELLDIKPSSVTAQVNRLEESGLVERRTDENDGRVSRVFLTEAGRTAQSDRKEQHDVVSEGIFDVLSEEEQQQLKTLIQKLVNAHADDEWNCEEFAGHGFGPTFNPHEMHRAMNDMRRAGRDIKREMRQNMRTMTSEERHQVRGSWGIGSNFKEKNLKNSDNKDENWDDF